MAQATADSHYTVQANDTLFTIAQQAYGDASQWQKIYDANKQAIGNDPNTISIGTVIYIPPAAGVQVKTCKITSNVGLNIRSAPDSHSTLIAHYPVGTVLNFVAVVNGENVSGNPHWGHSQQNHYFWLGGTDHPNG